LAGSTAAGACDGVTNSLWDSLGPAKAPSVRNVTTGGRHESLGSTLECEPRGFSFRAGLCTFGLAFLRAACTRVRRLPESRSIPVGLDHLATSEPPYWKRTPMACFATHFEGWLEDSHGWGDLRRSNRIQRGRGRNRRDAAVADGCHRCGRRWFDWLDLRRELDPCFSLMRRWKASSRPDGEATG